HGEAAPPAGLDLAGDVLEVVGDAVDERDVSALVGEGQGDRAAHAAPGSGDRRHLSGQRAHTIVSPLSTKSTWPWMRSERGPARKTTASAMSSGVGSRLAGSFSRKAAMYSSSSSWWRV